MTLSAKEKERLSCYREELSAELQAILHYWRTSVAGGSKDFYGEVDDENNPDPLAAKGVVLFSRILWTFSKAWSFLQDEKDKQKATIAYKFIRDHFIDRKEGGAYWSVTADGKPLDTKKQVYGQAFCIYGLAAYAEATADDEALQLAKNIFFNIEQHSFDEMNRGYIEAFTAEWKAIEDLRLSDKDANEKKTMNTHLHLVEAYAALYKIWPDNFLKQKIQGLLDVFHHYILTKEKDRLHLFLTETWEVRSSARSFGHDIEAAWLLQECATIIEDEIQVKRYKEIAIQLADAVIPAIDTDGGLWYEYDPERDHWIQEKHWWPQAEAMVGFFNAWELTGHEKYLELSIGCWQFVKKYLKDEQNGEWFWGTMQDYTTIKKGKAGFWKCPYHNGRACMEIIQRINTSHFKSQNLKIKIPS
jgi:mannobiose 2-epimerase